MFNRHTSRSGYLGSLALTALALTTSCVAANGELDDETGSASGALTITHTWDLATKMPSRLAIMFTMAWFGIDDTATNEQLPKGADPTYQNWKTTPTCATTSQYSTSEVDPSACGTCVRRGSNNACVQTSATQQRRISSRQRPLAGIWSATGRDLAAGPSVDESKKRLDLLLSMIRRPGCRADDGAKLDAWAVQLVTTSSKFLTGGSAATNAAIYPYEMLSSLFVRARDAGIPNAVLPGYDATWMFRDLSQCGGSKTTCMSYVRDDFATMATLASQYSSALKINGKPVILVYTSGEMTSTEWRDTVLNPARNQAGLDFYVIGTSTNSALFDAFDALAPWISSSSYTDTTASVYTDSYNYAKQRHTSLLSAVGSYPGRVVFAGVTPGFDDWTRNWNGPTCKERVVPIENARDPALMTAQMDFLDNCKSGTSCTSSTITSYDFRGVVGETWDDWTEGSQFEPSVAEGADRLVRFRQLLGNLFGDTYPDAAGDSRLTNVWNSYGQARNCSGSSTATVSPVTDLSCDPPPSGQIMQVPTATSGSTEVVGVPTDDPALYHTYVDDGLTPNDDTNYVRSLGGSTAAFHSVTYPPLTGQTATAVTVTYRAKRTPSATCTPKVDLFNGASTSMGAKTGAPLTETWTTYTLTWSGLNVSDPTWKTKFIFGNVAGNSGQCWYTDIYVTTTAGQNILSPTATSSSTEVAGVPTDDPALYYTYVDDGLTPNDDTNYVRSLGGSTAAFHSVTYPTLTGQTVNTVTVTYRAKRTTSASCTPKVDLFNGASTSMGVKTGAPLTETWTNYTLTWTGLNLSAPTFKTKLIFGNVAGNTGQCWYTDIYLSASP